MKTIDEAAKEYASNLSSSEVFRSQHDKDFKSGVEFAQRWILISQEEPEHYELNGLEYMPDPVLVKKWDQIRIIKSFYQLVNFTHWRPIELK